MKKEQQKPTVYDKVKRGVDVASTAVKAYALAKSLALIINVEKKKKDTNITASPYTGAPHITHISAIGQGNNIDQRGGNSIKLNYISLKGLVSYATGSSSTLTTLFLIQDTQQVSDTTPTVNDIFESSAGALGVLNQANLGRFRILWKKKITQDGSNARSVEQYKRLKFHLRYNGTATSDIQRNGLYFIALSNQVVASAPVITMWSRLAYVDN